jgi:hypothetical protein
VFSRAEVPHLGLGLAVEKEVDELPEGARFVEILVVPELSDDDELAPATEAAVPCIAHAGAAGPLSPMEIAHLARVVAARGAHWLSLEPVGYAVSCTQPVACIPRTAEGVTDMVTRAVKIGAQLPFVLSSAMASVLGEMHYTEFLAQVATGAGCSVRLDLDHLDPPTFGENSAVYLDGLPFDRIVAIAVREPAREAAAMVAQIVPRCASLRAVVVRGDAGLEPWRRILRDAGWNP